MHGHGPQPEGHMASHIEPRKFLATVGGVATAWPLAARAQQPRKVPRIGVLLPGTPTSFAPRTKAFVEGLQDLGYVEGRRSPSSGNGDRIGSIDCPIWQPSSWDHRSM